MFSSMEKFKLLREDINDNQKIGLLKLYNDPIFSEGEFTLLNLHYQIL